MTCFPNLTPGKKSKMHALNYEINIYLNTRNGDTMLGQQKKSCNLFKAGGDSNTTLSIKAIDYRIRKACLPAKAGFIHQKCTDLDNLEFSSPKECLERITEITGKFSGRPSSARVIKDGNGQILLDKLDVRYRWKEYIQDLYSDNSRKQLTIKFSGELAGKLILEEVVSATKKTPKGRASGRDEIPADLYKILNEVGAETL